MTRPASRSSQPGYRARRGLGGVVTARVPSQGHHALSGRPTRGLRAHRVVACALLAVSFSVGGLALAAASAAGVSAGQLPHYAVDDSHPITGKRPAPPPDIATGRDNLELLSQTPWVDPDSTQFRLHLQVTAQSPASEMLAVNVYTGLTTRSQFQGALGGEFYGSYYQPGGGPVPLTDLARDPSGGVDVDIPVNQSSGELATTGVYPVQVFLEQGGVPMGKPLTTFIVYAGRDLSPLRLDASFVLPMVGNVQIGPLGAPGRLSPSAAATLRGDAAALARWQVPVTIRTATPTVRSLAGGTAADRAALVDLREAIRAGDELLPATALPLDIQQLVGSGLTNDLSRQLSLGDATLDGLLGVQPPLTTWVSAGDLDPASMSALAGLGVIGVAVPEQDLSTLPLADQEFTFAQPTKLSVQQGQDIVAVGADSELSARVGQAAAPGTAVLVANQFLAELAMIDLERPSDQRGVVVVPPPGVAVSPVFLSVLLAGLKGNPLVEGVALQQLLKDVPLAPGDSGGVMVRQLDETSPPEAQLAGVGQLQQARDDVAADGEVYGPQSSRVTGLNQRLFVSLSSAFDGSQRASIIAGVLRAANSALANVRLPPSTSITLTSRQGRLPLTLVSATASPVRVRLVLTSEQLSFLAATFSEGSCVPVNNQKSAEDCQLTLSRPTTVLRVPVVVRAPGAFPLDLQVETPSGSMVLRSSTDSVRSTAISDVGWFLMVGAALFLAVWWVRNARHGRRAHRLVPRPDDGSSPDEPAPDEHNEADLGPDDLRPHDLRPNDLRPNDLRPNDLRPNDLRPAGVPGPTLPGEDAPRPGVTRPSVTSASASSASASSASGGDAGAASPVGAAPHFAVRTGRVGYPGKHALRPPR